ncbi:MAG: carboxypeptidase-like regulatory domain-containing protein [Treponema sp.]|nr:carboxypeptidase-like regulatory domain-containing protein [Treponema sp.]
MKKVFNFRTVMVTVCALTMAIWASSCSLIFSDDDRASSSDFGAIRVDFGENSRAIIQLNSSTVSNFHVSVTNGTDVSKNQDVTWGGSAEFADLAPGTYTVTAVAYVGTDVVQRAKDTVKVTAGETATASLSFYNSTYRSTKLVMPRINGWNEGLPSNYSISVFNDVSDISADLQKKGDAVTTTRPSYMEANDGSVFWTNVEGSNLKLKKYGDASYSRTLNVNSYDCGALYYDFMSDKMYYYKVGDTDGYIYEINDYKKSTDTGTDSLVVKFPRSLSAYLYGVNGFAIDGTQLIIIGLNNENESGIFYGTIESQTSLVKVTDKSFRSIFGDYVDFRDITIYEKGKAAVIVAESDVIYPGSNDFISRGAMVLFSYGGSQFSHEKTVGWYDHSRQISQKGTFVSTSGDNDSIYNISLTTATVFGPSKAEAKNYFYGPVKIICVKPKELYIVDEGINVNLADWNKRDRDDIPKYSSDQNGLTGNIFIHSRIVKVDLDTFAFAVEKDYSHPIITLTSTIAADGYKYNSMIDHIGWVFSARAINSTSGIGEVCAATNYLGVHVTPVECEE